MTWTFSWRKQRCVLHIYDIHIICLYVCIIYKLVHIRCQRKANQRKSWIEWFCIWMNILKNLCMNEKVEFVQLGDSAFLGLISRPVCTIEQLLQFEIKAGLDDSPSIWTKPTLRNNLSVNWDCQSYFLDKPNWIDWSLDRNFGEGIFKAVWKIIWWINLSVHWRELVVIGF